MKNHAIIKVFAAFNIVQLRQVSRLFKLLLTAFLLINGTIAFAQIGVQTNFPDASSALDIVSSDKGLLIPRVTLTANLGNPSPVTTPATGLMVFNSGSNQPLGFYYWDGSQWVPSEGSNDFWSLTGNSGTTVGTHYIGTTDMEDFAIFTDKSERMRVEEDGQVIIGSTAPQSSVVIFTVIANATQNYAMGAYSPNTGVYTASGHAGFYSNGGKYGLVALMDSASGFGVYARNYNNEGYGIITTGSGSTPHTLANHSTGLASTGDDGIFCVAGNSSGTGILAGGNNVGTLYFLSSGTGGAFTGYHGVYGKGINSSGIGIVGVGNNGSTYSFIDEGSGGSFTGHHGLYAKGNSSAGIGIIGVGNNGSTYSTISDGSGGAFTGYHGSYSHATNSSGGIGVIGVGNDYSTHSVLPDGSGGAFTGYHGLIATGKDEDEGTGLVGVGNDGGYSLLSYGSGGAFTGDQCGVFGYATSTGGDRYGGYFAAGGGRYAYVGGRYSGTYRKIVGNGSVNTIVKNTKGEIVTLACPEAPETVFQDFGIGQLVEGFAHITIDPDLAININVNEEFPLKVFITPEGDCKGVYVTNKSAEGFDVIELQGAKSNVPFSWQIVATRANEEYVCEDGTVEISDYSQRFQAAPPPLKIIEGQFVINESNNVESVSEQLGEVNSKPVNDNDAFPKR